MRKKQRELSKSSMKVAIDFSPLSSGHSVRGVGFYLKHLKDALEKLHTKNSYIFFTDTSELHESFDVIHYPYFDPFQRTLPYQKKHKTVVTVHDLTPIVFPELFPVGVRGRLNWEMQKRSLRRVDAVITDSECSSRDVIRFTGIPGKKIASVYLAAGEEFRVVKVSENEKKKLQERYNLPEKFVLYVGDVTPNKNLPRLIEALKRLNIPLVMVGKALHEREYDGTHPWNKDLVTVHRLTDDDKNIHILGFVPSDDLVALYNIATAFVFPSLYEGFGLPVIEAMASGCPVITTREGSLPEVAGDAPLYVDARHSDNIAEGIKKVFADKELRQQLSVKGLKQAEKFSWKKTAEETIRVYEKVLSS
jgi:glycosyltransferase involved in cell wall biosynthesis